METILLVKKDKEHVTLIITKELFEKNKKLYNAQGYKVATKKKTLEYMKNRPHVFLNYNIEDNTEDIQKEKED